MCSLMEGFVLIVPLKATRDKSSILTPGVQFDSTVWCTQQRLSPRYDAHRDIVSAVGCTPRRLTRRCGAHGGFFFFKIWNTRLGGMMHTVGIDSAVGCTPWSFIKIWMFVRSKKIIWVCLSMAQMGSNHENNRDKKSRDTLPLGVFFIHKFLVITFNSWIFTLVNLHFSNYSVKLKNL